jgi:uncharacterized protein (UPF0248 family)
MKIKGGFVVMPIQDLLHRIQWDPEFGRGEFRIGYLDRVAHRIVHVSWPQVRLEPGEHFALEVIEDDGSLHMVPLHRVREVWRDGELIWQRTGAP